MPVSTYCKAQTASLRVCSRQFPHVDQTERHGRTAQLNLQVDGQRANYAERSLPPRPSPHFLEVSERGKYPLEQFGDRAMTSFPASAACHDRRHHRTEPRELEIAYDQFSAPHRRHHLASRIQHMTGISNRSVDSHGQSDIYSFNQPSSSKKRRNASEMPAVDDGENFPVKRPRLRQQHQQKHLLQTNYDAVVISRSSMSRILSVVKTNDAIDFRLSETVMMAGTRAAIRSLERRQGRAMDGNGHERQLQLSGHSVDPGTAIEAASTLVDSGYDGTMTTLNTPERADNWTVYGEDRTRLQSKLAKFESAAETMRLPAGSPDLVNSSTGNC